MNKRTFLNRNWSPYQTREKGNLSLKGSQQHRRDVTTNISKFMKLKLEKSTARIMRELSADEVFEKMIDAKIKQLPAMLKPLPNTK